MSISQNYIDITGLTKFNQNPQINSMKMAPVCSGKANPGTVNTNTYADVSVTFPFTFESTPNVVVGFDSTSTAAAFGKCSVSVCSVTTTGATFRVFNADAYNRSPDVIWIATQN